MKKTSQTEQKEPTKKEILEGIKQGFNEVRLAREGKLKLKSMKELLDEIEDTEEESKNSVTMKDFRGTLSKESADILQDKIKKERNEWR